MSTLLFFATAVAVFSDGQHQRFSNVAGNPNKGRRNRRWSRKARLNRNHQRPPQTQSQVCDDIELGLSGSIGIDRVVLPTEPTLYMESIQQYAFSSVLNGTLHPSAVIYAENVTEVQKVLQYATQCKYTVAIRSGGHQYTGLSSCNSAEGPCLQVDVSRMDSLTIDGSTVEVGPGVTLGTLSQELGNAGLFVPAGDCSEVRVGGHGQTGGAGIFERSFGFFSDRITAFTMVLAGGVVRKVVRPTGTGDPKSFSDQLYFAAMGGSAGSYGIVTSYTVEALRNSDYPVSTYYTCIAAWNPEAYLAAGNVLHSIVSSPAWENNAATDESIFVTVAKREPLDFNFIHIEGVWSGVSGQAFDDQNFQRFQNALMGFTGVQCFAMQKAPSDIVLDHTMFWGPRELPFPYVRSAKHVKGSVGPEALAVFARSIDSMMDIASGVYPVHQLATMGAAGNTPQNVALSAVPHRDAAIMMGINVFYAPGALPVAQSVMDGTWSDLMETPTFKNKDYRLGWGPDLGTSIQQTWSHFWDRSTYNRLRFIKTLVDPTNVFRTSFTIPPFTRHA